MGRVRRLHHLVLVGRRLDGVGVADGRAAVRRRVPGCVALVPLVPARRVGPPALAPDQPRTGGDGYHDDRDDNTHGDGCGPC